jgi:hypothetical protein
MPDALSGLGFVIIGLFLAAWALSHAIYKAGRLDDIEMARSGGDA